MGAESTQTQAPIPVEGGTGRRGTGRAPTPYHPACSPCPAHQEEEEQPAPPSTSSRLYFLSLRPPTPTDAHVVFSPWKQTQYRVDGPPEPQGSSALLWQLFNLLFLKTSMAIFPAYVPVSHVHEVPMEARRHCWITLDWSYRQLLATTWVFRYKSRSSWKRNQHS